jgi:hypothetical protein
MTQVFYHSPGQSVTIVLETLAVTGAREDSPSLPIVNRIILPSLTLAGNYPQTMIRLDTGLYYYKFALPTGATAIGTYIVDVSYVDPAISALKSVAFQVVVTATAGNFGLNSAV